MLGGLFGLKYRDNLHYIISFTAGVLLGITFFEVIPEIFSLAYESGRDITPALVVLVGGFLAVHILEKFAIVHNVHESEYAAHKHPVAGLVGASGLVIHSFLDGIGIGLGFHVSVHTGILISLAVIAHDFSDGLNTVSIMLLHRNTPGRSIRLLIADAVAPVLGAASTFLFVIPDRWLMLYLASFAGFLLYIGASDLLPEAHSTHSSMKLVWLTVAGAAFMFFITRFI